MELSHLERKECSGHCAVMTKMMTPAQVAKMAGCGRSSVMRALSSRDLLGIRDNSNRWKISEADARSWAGQRPESDQKLSGQDRTQIPKASQGLNDTALIEAKMEALKYQTQADAFMMEVVGLKEERARLLGIIEKLSETRPVKLGFFHRIFRK